MKLNLKEFQEKDKKRLINSGDLITVSYELEMESEEEIDERGFFVNEPSIEKLNSMSPREQVEYLDIKNRMKRTLSAEFTLYDLYRIYTNDGTSTLYSRLFVMITTAYSLDEAGDFLYSLDSFDDHMMESWLLKSFLMSNQGRPYQNKLFYEIVSDEASMEKLEAYLKEEKVRYEKYLTPSEILLLALGFEDVINFKIIPNPRNRIDCGARDIFALFFGEDLTFQVFNDELSKIDRAITYLYGNKDPGLDEVITASNSYLDQYTNSAGTYTGAFFIKDFKEFNQGVTSLADLADSFLDEQLNEEIDNFDINNIETKWGIVLNNLTVMGESKFPTSNSLSTFLPNFWAKYGSEMDVLTDGSLPANHNLEIKMKTYITGLDSALEYVDDFYDDFEHQNNFKFTNATGLHTNVSMELKNKEFNLIKAILFLSEETPAGNPSKAYQGIEQRYQSTWSKPLKQLLLRDIKETLLGGFPALRKLLLLKYKEGNLKDIEQELNFIIQKRAKRTGTKDHGLNLQYIESRGYIEFRYPGRIIKRNTLKELTAYYAHVVRASLDPSYKEKEYKQKLIGFLNESGVLSAEAEDRIDVLPHLIEIYKQSISMAEKYKTHGHLLRESWINSIIKNLRIQGTPEWINVLATKLYEIETLVPNIQFIDICFDEASFYSLFEHFQGNKILGRLLKSIIKRESPKDAFIRIFCLFNLFKEGYYTIEELNKMGIDKVSADWYFNRILDIMTQSSDEYVRQYNKQISGEEK